MKPLLFTAALALSCTLVVMVSAQQCDLIAASACANDFAAMVSDNTTDTTELLRIVRDFCQSECVTTLLPACRSVDPSNVDQIMQGCERFGFAVPNGGASSGTVYSSIALLSSVFLAGVAAVFH